MDLAHHRRWLDLEGLGNAVDVAFADVEQQMRSIRSQLGARKSDDVPLSLHHRPKHVLGEKRVIVLIIDVVADAGLVGMQRRLATFKCGGTWGSKLKRGL